MIQRERRSMFIFYSGRSFLLFPTFQGPLMGIYRHMILSTVMSQKQRYVNEVEKRAKSNCSWCAATAKKQQQTRKESSDNLSVKA